MTSVNEEKGNSSKVKGNVGADFFHNLGRMPDEVLILIFRMLPPPTLLLLERSEEWVRKVVLSVNIANFTSCRFIILDDIKKFLKARSFHIIELQFDNLVFVKSRDLTNVITKCRQLKVLSARNCGLLLEHLYIVFKRIRLEDLSWTVINPSRAHPVRHMVWTPELHIKQLKKVNLEIGDSLMFHYFLCMFFPLTHDLLSIRIDYTATCKHQELQFGGRLLAEIEAPSLPYLCHLIVTWPLIKTMLLEHINMVKEQNIVSTLEWLFKKRPDDSPWKTFWIVNSFDTDEILRVCKVKPKNLSSASCLFIAEADTDRYSLQSLKNIQPNTVNQLGIYVPKLGDNHVQLIRRVGGQHLKQFSAIAIEKDNILMEIVPFYNLLKTCRNITDLDISGIHVTDRRGTSLCSAVAVLKDLRRLSLPVCAITDIPVHVAPTFLDEDPNMFAAPTARKRLCKHNAINQNAAEIFGRMVRSCSLVEDFHLMGCFRCGQTDVGSIFCENIIADMFLWYHLKHLRIDNVPSLRLFTFLDSVAKHCDNFTSLHLANVGHHQVFHFMSSLVNVLKLAPNFAFLRIVHYMFDCCDQSFWQAVASAKNLQGLCIASEHSEQINGKIICDSISELRYFHIFHLHCKYASQKHTIRARIKSILGKRTGRGADVDNVNLIVENVSHDESSGLLREPHCHLFHCGIKDSSVKGPRFM